MKVTAVRIEPKDLTSVTFEITDAELARARITASLRPPPPETSHEWINYLSWLHHRIREADIYNEQELEEMGIKV